MLAEPYSQSHRIQIMQINNQILPESICSACMTALLSDAVLLMKTGFIVLQLTVILPLQAAVGH